MLRGASFNYIIMEGLISNLTGLVIRENGLSFGLVLWAAVFAGAAVFLSELKRRGARTFIYGSYADGGRTMIYKKCLQLVIISVIAGFIGARLLPIIVTPGTFIEAPLFILLSSGKFNFYGGFFAALTVAIICSARYRIKYWHILDAVFPALLLAYAVGRLGCHVSDNFISGLENNGPRPAWLSFLPDFLWTKETGQVPIVSYRVFPTQLYEAICCFVLFGTFWISRRSIKAPGIIFGSGLLLFGLQRYLIEELRTDYGFTFLVKQPQFFSLCLVILGTVILYRLLRRNAKQKVYYGNYLRINGNKNSSS
jgi:phosphatidylglycerol---prolipoprotein diacylglyceryl transferase